MRMIALFIINVLVLYVYYFIIIEPETIIKEGVQFHLILSKGAKSSLRLIPHCYYRVWFAMVIPWLPHHKTLFTCFVSRYLYGISPGMLLVVRLISYASYLCYRMTFFI